MCIFREERRKGYFYLTMLIVVLKSYWKLCSIQITIWCR